MILDKEEVDCRLNSTENLLNRLRRITSVENRVVSIPNELQIGGGSQIQHPSLPPSVDELVDNVEDKLATQRCYSGAKEVLASAISGLKNHLHNVDNPVQLSRIATDMGRIVNGFDENRKEKVSVSIPIIYRPIQLTEQNFQVIQVNE